MESKIIANGILRALGVVTGVLLLVYLLYKVQSVIIYLILAIILSLIGRPIVDLLAKKLKFPNVIAVISTMTIFLLAILGIISMFIPLVQEQGHNISLLNTEELRNRILNLFQEMDLFFASRKINLFGELKTLHRYLMY